MSITQYEAALIVGGLLSGAVATSAALVARQRTSGWLIGIGAQLCWVVFAVVTRTWTLLVGPLVVGPVFVHNWLAWRTRDRKTQRTQELEMTSDRSSPSNAPA